MLVTCLLFPLAGPLVSQIGPSFEPRSWRGYRGVPIRGILDDWTNPVSLRNLKHNLDRMTTCMIFLYVFVLAQITHLTTSAPMHRRIRWRSRVIHTPEELGVHHVSIIGAIPSAATRLTAPTSTVVNLHVFITGQHDAARNQTRLYGHLFAEAFQGR